MEFTSSQKVQISVLQYLTAVGKMRTKTIGMGGGGHGTMGQTSSLYACLLSGQHHAASWSPAVE